MTHAEKRAEQEFPDLEFKGIIGPSSKRLLQQSIEARRTAFIAGWDDFKYPAFHWQPLPESPKTK
jgi:hypothetical protein